MEAIQQILTTLYVALGEAAGGPKAMRTANQVLRDAIADNAVDDPATIRFLQSLAHDEDDTPEVQITRPNIAASIFRPVAALGQSSELSDIASAVSSITLDLSDISVGKCGNKKLC